MAGRGRTSFQKRQKEQLRLEKRQQKAAQKAERKNDPNKGAETDIIEPFEDVAELDRFTPGEDLNPAGGLGRS